VVEKPMALDGDECRQMIAACYEAGRVTRSCVLPPLYPGVLELQRLLQTQVIGQVVQVRVQFGSYYAGRPDDGRGGWRTVPALSGGGALIDIGSHRIDLLLHLLGPIVEVSALTSTQAQSYVVEDSASLLLQFASGVHGLLGIYWNMHQPMDQLEIIGTKGRLNVSDLEAGVLELHVDDDPPSRWVLPPPRPTHLPLVADIVQSVVSGRPVTVPCEAGLAAAALVDAAYRSAREHCSVGL
jgi:predicted dehydrogenase